ncbi:sigma-70 family RNA polymerase sigma factor [Catellatospora coxensis]|uniref:sigma-70 family RNA polymerase sigma factor n=1 Tax=Catellatospora coxensis TaxID=310354 RepID=UPI001EF2EA8C|nr:sigma-70 family RNA polymerase sigma factor [Catellatospora coxensis]
MTSAFYPAQDQPTDPQSDPQLICLVRGGDTDAFGLLYERHLESARRLARVLSTDHADADDLIADTFAKVLAVLRNGGGPDTAFRAYLLTTMRHTRYDRARRERRVELTDDLTRYERAEPVDDPTISRLETSYAARAFNRLPERWRAVLWHTEVEGESPSQVAPLLGLTPNGVAALAYRARERLRQMYLQEHIALTGNPRCHWTGSHLAGYVRAALAKRDRSKVDEHLSGCAECRRLHRELTEENAGLRGVVAPLLLGAAAPAYLADVGTLGGRLTAAWGALVLWWDQVGENLGTWSAAAATVALAAGRWLLTAPGRLISRYGGASIVAGSGVGIAALAGIAVFVAMTATPTPPTAPSRAVPVPAPAAPPVFVPAPPSPAEPLPAVSSPVVPTSRPSPPGRTAQPPAIALPPARPPAAVPIPPPAAPAPVAPAPVAPAPPAEPDAEVSAPELTEVDLVAGRAGTLPIPVRASSDDRADQPENAPGASAEQTGGAADATAARFLSLPASIATEPESVPSASPVAAPPGAVRIDVTLPAGLRLAGTAAGDGWQCEATATGASCDRPRWKKGARSVARLPVLADTTVSGFQEIGVAATYGQRQRATVFRVPVAPSGLRLGHAARGRVDVALAGSALLSCRPRPLCLLGADNNVLDMTPLLPAFGEPAAPGGLLDEPGPAGPDGPIAALAGEKAASGARLELPDGAKVRWAGLVVAASAAELPELVALHGPKGDWSPVEVRFGHAESGTALTQGFADVTKLLRKGGGGDWWLAAPAEPLPRGRKQFAGWTLAVVYEHRDLPRGEAAVYLGPRTGRGDAATVIGLGGAGPVRIGLALWDGDLALTGDELLIDGVPAGEPGNLGGGRNAGAAALACRPVPGLCPWRTPGLDVLRVDGKAPAGGVAELRTGGDPLEVGLLAVVTGPPRTPGKAAPAR